MPIGSNRTEGEPAIAGVTEDGSTFGHVAPDRGSEDDAEREGDQHPRECGRQRHDDDAGRHLPSREPDGTRGGDIGAAAAGRHGDGVGDRDDAKHDQEAGQERGHAVDLLEVCDIAGEGGCLDFVALAELGQDIVDLESWPDADAHLTERGGGCGVVEARGCERGDPSQPGASEGRQHADADHCEVAVRRHGRAARRRRRCPCPTRRPAESRARRPGRSPGDARRPAPTRAFLVPPRARGPLWNARRRGCRRMHR